MSYITPRDLRWKLQQALEDAGFKNPVATWPVKYVERNGEACLRAGCFQYAHLLMHLDVLEGYENVLRELPGVVETQIVHKAPGINPLRDQVIVWHWRLF
jgi:hypothetical protein